MIYRILVVEDQDDLREIARFALESPGPVDCFGTAAASPSNPDMPLEPSLHSHNVPGTEVALPRVPRINCPKAEGP